jgi:glucokinase
MATETLGLVADIGSTNARFALVMDVKDGIPVLSDPVVLHCRDFPTLDSAIRRYFAMIDLVAPPRAATLAVAAPVTGDTITLTNNAWRFSITEMRASLGLDHLQIINDFTAISLSLLKLTAQAWTRVGPEKSLTGARTVGVIGPGSGLGVGGLLDMDGRHVPLPSEGGHMNFAPQTDVEWEIAKILHTRFGHVSNERLLSGPGLVNIFEALCRIAGEEPPMLSAADISAYGVNGNNRRCREALELFCGILGSAAGDLALLLYADAIFVAGGIVPRFVEFMRGTQFRARFEAKGRFSQFLVQVPTLIVTEKYPGLIGAAVHLMQHHGG